MVMIVNTVIVITSSINEKPLCCTLLIRLQPAKRHKKHKLERADFALFVPLDDPKTLLLHGRCSLNHLRRHIARVSGYKVQRLLYKNQRGIACTNRFQIDKEQWSGAFERCLTVKTRDRYQARA